MSKQIQLRIWFMVALGVVVNAALLLILWGIGAFVTWEGNPVHWTADGRSFLVFSWLSASIPFTPLIIAACRERMSP